MGEIRKPAYWAVLPASVRYDTELRPNAKLLYAEITALADAKGYCWATNEHLAQLFGIAARTISDLISTLSKKAYVTVEIVRDHSTNEILERRIWIEKPAKVSAELPAENTHTPIAKNGYTPIAKNGDTPIAKNGYKNNINIYNIPPIPPKGGERVSGQARKKKRGEPLDAPMWLPERFAGFWKVYPRGEAKQSAIRAWDKLQPSENLLCIMGAALLLQLKRDDWQREIGIPYASTWLNQRRWEDEQKQSVHAVPEGVSGWAADDEVI